MIILDLLGSALAIVIISMVLQRVIFSKSLKKNEIPGIVAIVVIFSLILLRT